MHYLFHDCNILIGIVTIRNKRKRQPIDYDEQNDSDTFYSEDDQSSTSSDESDDDEDVVEPQNVAQQFVWNDVSSTFKPRQRLPEKKEVLTSCDENYTITQVFLKLFPKSLFIWISDCTNERLEILSEKQGKPAEPTDPHEIMVVVGCLLIMSYNRVPHMHMYWSRNKTVRNETIASSISRDRFMLLHSKLYFNHPKKPVDAEKSYYTSELINCLIYTFNRYRSEATYQSIDEFMVAFKGRSSMKQYVPIKPIKRGIKGFCRACACSGYVYDCFIYQGKDTEREDSTLGEWVRTVILNLS